MDFVRILNRKELGILFVVITAQGDGMITTITYPVSPILPGDRI